MALTTLLKYTFELRCNIKVISLSEGDPIFPLDQLNNPYLLLFFYYNERNQIKMVCFDIDNSSTKKKKKKHSKPTCCTHKIGWRLCYYFQARFV